MTQLHLVQLAEVFAKVCKLSLQCSNLPGHIKLYISSMFASDLHISLHHLPQNASRLLQKKALPQQAFQLIQICHLQKSSNAKIKNSKNGPMVFFNRFRSLPNGKFARQLLPQAATLFVKRLSCCEIGASDLMICHLKGDFEIF